MPFIPDSTFSRRAFLEAIFAAAAFSTRAAERAEFRFQVIGFVKPFQNWSAERLAALAREAGWDGIEVPVRKGGTIEPERVETELPKFAAALRKAGTEISLIATDVENAADPL